LKDVDLKDAHLKSQPRQSVFLQPRFMYPTLLVGLGIGWGATQPLGKLAASSGHKPFGLIFWQLLICTFVLGMLTVLRGKSLPLNRGAVRFYVVIAILGTLVPNATFYASVVHLPAGIMSILISMVPLLAFPIALVLGLDRFSATRVAGLALGLLGVTLIVMPNTSLPDPAMAVFLPLAMVGPLFYAMEGIYVSHHGMAGLDAVQGMFGASLVGLLLCIPIMFWLDQGFMPTVPLQQAEAALFLSSSMHAILYTTYVWLAARAGSVFASQTSYIVTGSGVIWAMVILGERFSPWVWAAMGVMLLGLSLVQPRKATVDGAGQK
jgi:drug/metabolite transporter (DMT)-like permease